MMGTAVFGHSDTFTHQIFSAQLNGIFAIVEFLHKFLFGDLGFLLFLTRVIELQRRKQAMSMDHYHKTPHISYKDPVTNKEVRAKIQQAIGPLKDHPTIVKRCKLQWYGHVSHSSGLAKTVLQGTVKGGRRKGRQRKRWEDNIREWTDLEFAKSQRAVENRGKWRKLVAKLSVVPQQPLRLRDR